MPFMERLYSALILKTPMYDPMAGEIIEHKSEAVFSAIRANDEAELVRMIHEGFDVDYHPFGHPPPLIFAIKQQRPNIVQTLLLYGADPNLPDRNATTALHYAVKLAEPQSILLLLRYGADKLFKNNEGESAQDIAAKMGNKHIVKLLKEAESMVEEIGTPDLFKLASEGNLHAIVHNRPDAVALAARDQQNRTLLHHAVYGNNPKLVLYLLNKTHAIDSTDIHGITPLIITATHARFIKILQLLLTRSPTLEHRTNNHSTALTIALRNGNAEGARMLVENGANIFCVDGLHTPLTLVHRAIEEYSESADAFRSLQTLLLDRAAHNDIPTNKAGWTPLFHTAARVQDEGIKAHLRLLLQQGSDVNFTDANGRTPLMVAASMGRKYALEMLLKNYARIDHLDKFGWSALMLAVYYNHYDIAAFLLECGCDVNLTSEQGLNALKIAVKHQRKRLTNLLLEYGAEEINADDERREED